MGKLTDKQALFCKEYMIDLNATQAAIRAGYSAKNADKIGSELLGKTRVSEEIDRLKKNRSKKVELKAEDVLQEIKDMLEVDIIDIAELITKTIVIRDHKGNIMYDEDGRVITEQHQVMQFKDTKDMSKATRKAISEIGCNKHGPYIKLYNKQVTIEQAGRHLKLFTDKVEIDIKEMPKVIVGK